MTATAPASSRIAPKAATSTYGLRRRAGGSITIDGSCGGSGSAPGGGGGGGGGGAGVWTAACDGTGGSPTAVSSPSCAAGATNFVPHARHTTASPASLSGSRIDFPQDEHRTL